MFKRCLIASLSAFISMQITASELTLDKQVLSMAINGKATSEKEITLPNGKHQLVIRYSFPLDNNGRDKRIQSVPQVMTFKVTGQEKITLKAPRYNSYARAELAFRKDDIKWELVDGSGNQLNIEVQQLLGKQGFLPYADIEPLVTEFNIAHDIMVDEVKGIMEGGATFETQISETSQEMNVLQATMNTYLKLDEIERKQFRKWLVDQE